MSFTLNDTSGDITIDFPAQEGEELKVTVSPPKTFGAYKRIRAEVDALNKRREELLTTLREDDKVSASEMNAQVNGFVEQAILEWWRFVMVGDDSYAGRGSAAPPEDLDSYPLYLATNESVQEALAHWKTVPLVRGG